MGQVIFAYIVSIVILYLVIETAVRKGINSSVIGEYMKKKHDDDGEEERSIDIDNDHHEK